MTKRLEIKNVSKIFKKKIALEPFSLEAREGECIVLCGGNGAGKSTLLQILAGISHPGKGGNVYIDNINILENRIHYVKLIGYMPDEFFAQDSMTVNEFLAFYASLRKVNSEKVMEVIRLIGLDDKKDERIRHLSKGMRQRLLFGQALVGDPAVLIMDEPTNGLDPYWIDVFVDLIRKIKNTGTTIIFSTHMMDVAAEVGDRILFMEQGKLKKTMWNDHLDTKSFVSDLVKLYRMQES